MIKLLKGNCLDLLRQLEPGCADLVLIDPPYSSGGLFAGDRKQDTRVKYTDADFNGAARFPSFSGDNMDQHSFIQFMTHVSMELRELTKEGGTIAAFIDWRNLPAMTDAIQMAGGAPLGVGSLSGTRASAETSPAAFVTTASTSSGAPTAGKRWAGRQPRAPRPCRASTTSTASTPSRSTTRRRSPWSS